jgi:tricorn protease
MNNLIRLRSIVLAILAMIALGDAALAQGTRLLRRPAVSRELVAFEYGGDLWTVPRGGGQARRLTSTPYAEIDPRFSPDGSRLAFTATVGGNTDVYVVPVAGGEPTRLTFHPGIDAARGWSPDGSRVLFASTRETVPVPGLPSIFRTVVGGSRRQRRSGRGAGSAADAASVHRELFGGRPSRCLRRNRARVRGPTGRRTRAACGATIAAGGRVRSG